MTKESSENYQKSPNTVPNITCWVVVESGLRGTENQCKGLAERITDKITYKRIQLKSPWKQLSPRLPLFSASALTTDSDPITGPWPDLVISGGRKAAAVALFIKKQSGGKTKLVHVMNPRCAYHKFDLIITPKHDGVSGENIVATQGSLHHVTTEKLHDAKTQFSALYQPLPTPRIGVLIGGSSKAYTMTADITRRLAGQLKALAESGHGLMITASRRTGEENSQILKSQLVHPNIHYWDGSGENPYFGILGWADGMLVTEDSVSMVTEALATEKPTDIIRLEGGSSARFRQFHKGMLDAGYIKEFSGTLDLTTPRPKLNDMQDAAARVQALFA